MRLTKSLSLAVLSACSLWLGAQVVRAADSPLTEMDPEIAQRFGGGIVDKFTKDTKDLQVKIDPNAEKAVGLFNPETNEGIIAVPVKGWKEDPESKEATKDNGMPMCYLVMSSSYTPLVDGKPIDSKKIRTLKLKDREVICFLCTVKHNDDDWQVLMFGADKKPVITAQLGEDGDAPKGDLMLSIKEAKGDKATLVFNMFGKYGASLPISIKQK